MEQKLRLRKWSLAKFITLNNDISDILIALGDDFDFKNLKTAKIGQLIFQIGETIQRRLTHLVVESVEDPKDLKETDILEWDPEDFLGVLSVIIEQNLSPALQKKGLGLMRSVMIALAITGPTADQPTETVEKT